MIGQLHQQVGGFSLAINIAKWSFSALEKRLRTS